MSEGNEPIDASQSPGWVAVTERKPEIGQLVWISVRGSSEIGQYGDGLFQDKSGWICAVDYWRALVPPAPPNATHDGRAIDRTVDGIVGRGNGGEE